MGSLNSYFIGKFSSLELFFKNASSKTISCNVASQQEISEPSEVFDHRYSQTEAGTERIVLLLITLKFYY